MEAAKPSRLYRLAKRLSLGRLLRYVALWARYLLAPRPKRPLHASY